jgi:hypothetical protein
MTSHSLPNANDQPPADFDQSYYYENNPTAYYYYDRYGVWRHGVYWVADLEFLPD